MENRQSLLRVFLSFICIVLIVVTLYSILTGGDRTMTFRGFLDWISNFKPIFPDLAFVSNEIVDSWGLFDGLKNFINIFIDIFDFALYCVKSALNLVSYITSIIAFMFA